jgi:hypothetical protein
MTTDADTGLVRAITPGRASGRGRASAPQAYRR